MPPIVERGTENENDDARRQRIIFFACDGFGEDLKNAIKAHVHSKGRHEVKDFGTDTYYDAAGKVGAAVSKTHVGDNDVFGMLFCGTGMGVSICANKYPNVRAAVCENVTAARCGRAVNNANVLCLGQLVTPEDDAKRIVDAFLAQEFITHPMGPDGTTPVEWWSSGVEEFLSTSMDGIKRIEEDANRTAVSVKNE
mmetsp:Transcript_52904/g.63687  ORF Transcript_52904/g.63687 Transcript_52904/m.63687 type:complete len:196 (-) Transcript_52904:50-637(-)|eukprot:CAMPEP_0172489886 /NCGR_PEP_ID=MMETSP1066-20121228/20157_1 /TAXON_ID=671091 /ORGANISM="Coscinodiscus wailesii, Strain CCMP2513" /LENGTH=195 /DNA_ID=CAMNT_0013258073 /DNA_START=99 /DNA_END=686 /DNA_ORIENTATION=-